MRTIVLLLISFLYSVNDSLAVSADLWPCLVFLVWVTGFLVSFVHELVVKISPCQNCLLPSWSWLQHSKWAALLVSSLFFEFCQMALWPVNSAFLMSATSGHPFFRALLTSPRVWDGWRTSSSKTGKQCKPGKQGNSTTKWFVFLTLGDQLELAC